MPEMLLYEYAIIRVVPRVEREEFVNAGVILYCKEQKYLACNIHLPVHKVLSIDKLAALDEIEANLKAFEQIVKGESENSKIALLEAASRFRWLTATRSTIIQCSKVHIGQNVALEPTLKHIFDTYVM